MSLRLRIAASAVAALLLAGPALAADSSVSTPVTALKFFDTGVGPLKAAVGHGDLTAGAHSTYVKLPAGFSSPLHTHTEDYYAVVITGVVANEVDNAAPDRPLPPGSYWFQKGKAPHVTKCLSTTECVVFITQPGKFDYVNVN
ncbi:DUF4437 domain-containing protein [Derxia lacustris]|uniref:DUF4437 domain-containing protein n=1 Tax=Derxia lacustris TaxID=764842 RepID=UPI000A1706D3|nr:DUF4437 domain-containing protein [Derxia lacustris]